MMSMSKLQRTVSGDSRTLQDSGMGSFGSESDSSPIQHVQHNLTAVNLQQENENGTHCEEPPSNFRISYLGHVTLDKRHTQPMIPWMLSEMRRKSKGTIVELKICPAFLKAVSVDKDTVAHVMFEHSTQIISKFSKSNQHPKCFGYLTRKNIESKYTCHGFQADDESTVQEIFQAIRRASCTDGTMKDPSQSQQPTSCSNHSDTHATMASDASGAGATLFEVLYVGKVHVSSKKAPPTFIDEAVAKFLEYETKKDETRPKSHSLNESDFASQPLESTASSHATSCESLPSATGTVLALSGLTLSEMGTGRLSPVNQRTSDSPRSTSADTVLRQTVLSQSQKNRTMLLQIRTTDVCLISPDRKTTIFDRKFKDISFCSQGIHHPEHFGFISRGDQSSNSFVCYVFKCATEAVVEEVMQTLKQAFQAAFQNTTTGGSTASSGVNKGHIVCELCPMHQLHKLCLEIDKLSADKVHEILQSRIDQLNDSDHKEVLSKLKTENPQTIQEVNECLMVILRQMCEERQKNHVHLSNTPKGSAGKPEFFLSEACRQRAASSSKLDHLKKRAKKSLTSSFDSLIRPRNKREIAKEAEQSWATESSCNGSNRSLDSSSAGSPDSTPPMSPSLPNNRGCSASFSFGPQAKAPLIQSTGSNRPRSATVPDIAFENGHLSHDRPGIHGTPKASSQSHRPKANGEETSSARAMFIKMGQSPQVSAFMQLLSPSSMADVPSPQPDPVHLMQGISDSPLSVTPCKQTSWRLDILNRVVTPARRQDHHHSDCVDGTMNGMEEKPRSRMTPQKVRALWRKAILETLLLIRMERENKSLQARLDEVETKRQKLDYEEITPCLKEVTKVWDKMLTDPRRPNHKVECEEVTNALKAGVPRSRRGDIWQLCVEQHKLRYRPHPADEDDEWVEGRPIGGSNHRVPYEDLLKQLTVHQHAILIDLGRTFPAHPYFSTALGPGQLALFNLLKAYSLLDKEVGYCQGLSFVAGILLMHMPEERAFQTMKYMMFQLGFRRQYRPDMIALQIQMYQLSRLLHDYHRDLDEHLQKHDIAPTLYAAPWFLTIFASQFPLGFVARVFDLIFLQGLEVVFKVALVLLGNHKELIKQCDSFESNVEFLKTTLPSMGIIQMERVINQVFQLDISQQLQAYEVEYHVLQEEMVSRPVAASPCSGSSAQQQHIRSLEQANQSLLQQKMELLEQLQSARSHTRGLEGQLERLQTEQGKLNSHIRTLELERAALLNAVSRLQKLLPEKGVEVNDLQIPIIQPNRTITNSPIHNPLVNPLIAQFIEEGKIKLMSNSLTELDREVAALMGMQRQSNAASSASGGLSIPLPVKSTSGSNLHLSAQDQQGGTEKRPASSNM